MIRQATTNDLSRIAEMLVFNYRLHFYPIFKNDDFYFGDLQVANLAEAYRNQIETIWVYDDGVVKGFIQVDNSEIKKLFVEPVLQCNSIGSHLLQFAVEKQNATYLWALEKNTRAIRFYEQHNFHKTSDRKLEDGTTEYLIRMELYK